MNKVVLSKSDGRGMVQIVKSGAEHPDVFYLGGKALKVTKRGQINISKADMKRYGTRRPDGRYALILDIGGIHEEGNLKLGANIITTADKTIKNFLSTAKTGDKIRQKDLRRALDKDKIDLIRPREISDIYTA